MPKKMMTQMEYVADNGQSCPKCRGETLDFSNSDMDIGRFSEDVVCLSCDFEFVRVFVVSGFERKEEDE